MKGIFSSKIDRIEETLSLCAMMDFSSLVEMLARGAANALYAVGSGGSVITASMFSKCRMQLGHPTTAIVTPMAYLFDSVALDASAWFFSASGNNPDITAAFNRASQADVERLNVLTSDANGALAEAARQHGAALFVSPVAEPKDGFLATHSLVSAATSLIFAADRLAGHATNSARLEQLMRSVRTQLSAEAREQLLGRIAQTPRFETLVVLHDPNLAPAAVLVETSAWEAGLCSVQSTDFRNFAHGRHVWLSRRLDTTLVIALVSERSRQSWKSIEQVLPEDASRIVVDFGSSGRAANFDALIFGLALIEAIGRIKGVDPGKPGVPEFGKKIFESADLLRVVAGDEVAIRRKARSVAALEPCESAGDLLAHREAFVAGIEQANFAGLVLDYDGTVVATGERFDPPRTEIVDLLSSLSLSGLRIAFATGRGGSIGEVLRAALPEKCQGQILVGYYNGSWIAPLSVDIRASTRTPDPAIELAFDRLCSHPGLFKGDWRPRRGPLQITLPFASLVDPDGAFSAVADILGDLGVRMLRSGHSIDLFPVWASKRSVLAQLRVEIGSRDADILCVGDRGEMFGNDFELLEGPYGLSVGRVCARPHTCWNLMPQTVQGPLGLLEILRALKTGSNGIAKMTVPFSFSFG